MRTFRGAVLALLLVVIAAPAMALPGDAPSQISAQQEQLSALQELEDGGTISAEHARVYRDKILAKASEAAGHKMTVEELSSWKSYKGIFTFRNVILVLAAIVVIAAIIAFLGEYLMAILSAIPAPVWEVLGYIAAAALVFATSHIWLILPGVLGFGALVQYSVGRHGSESFTRKHGVTTVSAILAIAWIGVAGLYQSSIVGLFGVLALESLLGFSIFIGGLCVAIGWTDEAKIPRATFASLILMVGGILLYKFGATSSSAIVQFLLPLQPGLLFVGCFVYFLGLLIMSNRWYQNDNYRVEIELLTILSGFAALFVGSVAGVSFLSGIGGTFFALYLVEKYIDISSRGGKIAFKLFGFAALLYGIYWVMGKMPQYFLISF